MLRSHVHLGLLATTLLCAYFPPTILSAKKVRVNVNSVASNVTRNDKGNGSAPPTGDKESRSIEETRKIVQMSDDADIRKRRASERNVVHFNLIGKATPLRPANLSYDVRSKRVAPPLLQNSLLTSAPKNMTVNIPGMDRKDIDIPLSFFDRVKLTPHERSLLLSITKNKTTTREKIPLKRQQVNRPYPEDIFGEDEQHNVLRRRLLSALSRRIEARNMLMHEKALLRQRMLRDRLLEARNNYNGFPDDGPQRDKGENVIRERDQIRPSADRMGEDLMKSNIDFPARNVEHGVHTLDGEPSRHEIGSFVGRRNPEQDLVYRNNINDFNTESYREQPRILDDPRDHEIGPPSSREQELLPPYSELPLRRGEPRNHDARIEEGEPIPPGRLDSYGSVPAMIRAHVSPDYRSRERELLGPTSEGDGMTVRRTGIGKYAQHNPPIMYPPTEADNGAYDTNLQQQSDSIFEQPRMHVPLPLPYEPHKNEMMQRMGEGESMIPRSGMYRGNIGNLGDETLPYGSLGSAKGRNRDMIPDPMMRQPPKIPLQEDMDAVRGEGLPKEKKTWVTDVNVYSKKKKIDEIADLFGGNDDEDDAMDEYDPCERRPCENRGECKIVGNTKYRCVCPRSYRGKHCGTRNYCHPNPCAHGSKCTEIYKGFKCACVGGFEGKRCRERNYCIPSPCGQNGECAQSSSPDKYACACKNDWYGKLCDQRNICIPNPCGPNGVCVKSSLPEKFDCTCRGGSYGKLCNQKKSACAPNPCMNNGRCLTDGTNLFQCVCANGSQGRLCEESRTPCEPNPCKNSGRCLREGTANLYNCACASGFTGELCQESRTPCEPNPCKNSGRCLREGTGNMYNCACPSGFIGELCQERGDSTSTSLDTIAHVFNIAGSNKGETKTVHVKSSISFPPSHEISTARESACMSHPCLNGGTCLEDTTTAFGFKCECRDKYSGEICEERKCLCKNGGTCIGYGNEIKCLCKGGYGGKMCQEHTQCNEDTCMHGGICLEEVGGFRCKCDNGYRGQRCEEEDRCKPNPCFHGGTCKSYGDFHQCECPKGFKGKQCEDLDLCQPNPCQNKGQCFGYSGGYQCECNGGYSGKDCTEKRHCVSNPCSNGAECIEIRANPDNPDGSYKCGCKNGFTGKKCDTEDFCHSMPCHNGGSCTNMDVGYVCSCGEQYSGPQCSLFNHCYQSPCGKNGKCISTLDAYKCECDVGYNGDRCTDVDFCQPNPCKNLGFCAGNEASDGFVCHCGEGYQGLECNEPDPCYPNPCYHGNCSDVAGGFVCKCTTGFKGATCNEIDRCDPNPCFHQGNCEEINGGEGFACTCPAGYKGKMCERKDLCNPNPCHNEGLCEEFQPSLSLPSYRHNRYSRKYNEFSEYERDMIEGDGGVECTCMKGYHGKRCNEIDPCYPNPCLHEGMCAFNGHFPIKCNCSTGWKGQHCHSIDLCAPDPCRYGTHCRQNDEESYQCVRSLCVPNPCSSGGKCIVVNDESYECACPKGYKGALCEESDSCQPNPCNNDGICRSFEGRTDCECKPEFTGPFCDAKLDQRGQRNSAKSYCDMTPCKNGGSCIDTESGFTCRCTYGFAGPFCEDSVCFPSPCRNDGVCVPYYGIALCKCLSNYTGAHCSENKLANEKQPYHFNVKDQQSVAKSQTPHLLTQQLKNLDPTSPALIARVEEILNSYNDPIPLLQQQQLQQQQAAILNSALANNPGLAGKMAIPSIGSSIAKMLYNQSLLDGALQSNARNELPAVPLVPLMNSETGRAIFNVPVSTSTILNPMVSSPTSMNPASIFPHVQAIEVPDTTDTKSITLDAKEYKKLKQKHRNSEKEKLKFETVGAVPETNPMMASRGKQPSLAAAEKNDKFESIVGMESKSDDEEKSSEKNDKFESVGSVPDKCEPNPCRHGGTCVIRSNGEPECICTDNYSGPECRDVGKLGYSSGPKFFPHDECNHCDKEAICVNKHCICDKGFVGDGLECWPETIMDRKWDCEPNPCQNGGTCKKGRARCVCRLGYIGLFCENYCEPCVHLSFDRTNGPYIIDESGHHNNAIMKNGAFIANNGGKCDSGVSPSGGDILFGGKHFAPKPYDSITMVAWVKVDSVTGIQSIFDTVGGTLSTHREGQYHLEVDNNRIRWFHRNERHNTIFSVTSGAVVYAQNWTHIAGTYNAAKRMAMLYANGDLVGTNTNVGQDVNLSQDWDTKAGLGRHEHTFGNRVLHGVIDEFYIFPCTLPRLEILVLMHHCKVYWKHKLKKHDSPKRPTPDPIFDIDTALHQEKPMKEENVIALSETARALEKDLKKFQNYYGLKQDYDKHNRKEIETTGDSRFQISKPRVSQRGRPRALVKPARGAKKAVRKKVKAAEYMSVMPNGPTSMAAEVQGLLTTELGNKRMQISPNKRFPGSKSLSPKNNPISFAKYHRAPVVRNENKVLPFGPHAYFQQQHLPQAPFAKSSFPHKPNNARSKPNPRWFSWTKGLATTNGVTTTNTHANSKGTEPGKITMGNHVTSSQQSAGDTEIKQRYGIPAGNYIMNNGMVIGPNGLVMALDPSAPHANVNAQRVEQARRLAAQRYAAKRQGMIRNAQIARQMAAQRNAAAMRQQMLAQYAVLQKKDEDEGEMQTTEHKHQWGFGNGNGNGHGVGTPGASGSGGGWGAGGPMSSKVNFPNWNPSQGRFTIPGPPNARQPFRRHPEVTREMWNTFLAQKRQSNTNINAKTENTAQSVVNIEPLGGIKDGKVSGHQWGYGNGDGQGTGAGSPGGEGTGGGWGAGGPTKQESWLPPGQPPPPNQRSVIHSSTLPMAIAQSFKAPWLPQGGNDKTNNPHALFPVDKRGRNLFPYQYPNSYQINQARRSGIPAHPMEIISAYHMTDPRVIIHHGAVQVPHRALSPPLTININHLRTLQNNYPYHMYAGHSQPVTLVKHFSIPKAPIRRIQYHQEYVVPPPPSILSRSHLQPFYEQKHLYSVSIPHILNPLVRNRISQQKRTVIPRRRGVDPLAKHMTPQGIIETLPFLKKRSIYDDDIL